MARRSPGGQARVEQATPPAITIPLPITPPAGRLVFLPPDWLPKALIAGDIVIAAASVLLAYWFHHRFDPIHTLTPGELPLGPYLAAIPFVVLIYVAALTANHQYQSWRGRTLVDLLLQLYSGIGLAAILILAVISITNLGSHYSRLTITYAIVLSAVLMTVERYFLRQYETRLRRQGIGTERVLMVGTGAGSEMLIQRMNMFPQYGFQVIGVADDDRAPGSTFAGAPVVGKIDELHSLAQDLRVDQVFLALTSGSRTELMKLIKLCEDQNLEFKIVPDLLDVMSTRVDVNAIDGVPLVGIRRNRLRGDMSLVGPRPQPTFFDERYSVDVPRYLERQQVRPGLTGWAEVNDLRGAAPIGDRTLYDVYYIESWSLALDVKILLLTGIRIFFQRHAY